ncbi:type IX secretion system protein PorD [Aureivirga marina]|uniref:type IX secretion system protein PorD n=1 Tax=Aureivirga marina TaxID=1182451 RepID=UPI0018C91D22|nr:DUF4835 family protein [Aureivirga marina]
MNKLLLFIAAFFLFLGVNAQELNCIVNVNSDQVPGSNKQVFKSLQTNLTEFINQKQWTNKTFKKNEKIQCAITIIVKEQTSSNEFSGSIQIQSSRPVYDSSYLSPVVNHKDEDFNFTYSEFEVLQFNPNSFDSNLISVIAYYAYLIIGMDADTFKQNGGKEYFKKAQNVANLAQQSSYPGWSPLENGNTRYKIINDLLSTSFIAFKNTLYRYHLKGLDMMAKDKKTAKKNIVTALMRLKNIYSSRPNAAVLRMMMDAKSDEISNIFSGGPSTDVVELKEFLGKMSPTNSKKWNKIK